MKLFMLSGSDTIFKELIAESLSSRPMSLTSRIDQESCKLNVAGKLQELITDASSVEIRLSGICWEARTPKFPCLTRKWAGWTVSIHDEDSVKRLCPCG